MSDENYIWQDIEVRYDGIKITLKFRKEEEFWYNKLHRRKANNRNIYIFKFKV